MASEDTSMNQSVTGKHAHNFCFGENCLVINTSYTFIFSFISDLFSQLYDAQNKLIEQQAATQKAQAEYADKVQQFAERERNVAKLKLVNTVFIHNFSKSHRFTHINAIISKIKTEAATANCSHPTRRKSSKGILRRFPAKTTRGNNERL